MNLPLVFSSSKWDANKGNYSVLVNALTKTGFTKVHNLIDGFEEDNLEDSEMEKL